MVKKDISKTYEEIESLSYLLEKIAKSYDVSINLADIAGIRKINNQIEAIFGKYSYHNNSFCNYVKKDPILHSLCVKSKNSLCQRIRRPFQGRCYLGIYELYFPVWFKSQLIGLICVGQFLRCEEKSVEFVKKKAQKHGLAPEVAAWEYSKVTKEIDFSVEELSRDVGLAGNFLSLLYRNAILQRSLELKLSGSTSSAANYYQDKAIVSAAVEFINQNYKHISLDLIAENCYCNATYLSHLFNKELGLTITAYINKRKIDDAKKLLDLTELSITEISLEVGFNDPNYFAKVFKQIEGVNPSRYRHRS